MDKAADDWTVYMLRCGDGSLYTGVAKDLARRVAEHSAGRGAKYTRGRGPLEVVHVERGFARGDALRRELAIKRMSKRAKVELLLSVPQNRHPRA